MNNVFNTAKILRFMGMQNFFFAESRMDKGFAHFIHILTFIKPFIDKHFSYSIFFITVRNAINWLPKR
jgi:hypothetical protein